MKILLIGGNGFIGRHIASAAVASGHRVTNAGRRGEIVCNFLRDTSSAMWGTRVAPFDAVINCVGVLRASEKDHQRIHCDTPAAIAAACEALHKPFLHVSTLNLENAADTPYFQSKRAGEEAIRAVNSAAIIVRPSVVFGEDGVATQLMLLQARLPLVCLPARSGLIAPIHVDDLAELCVCLIGTLRALGCDVDAIGRETMTMTQYIADLRRSRGRPLARVLYVPNMLMRTLMRMRTLFGANTIVPEALDLIEHTHTGDARMFVRWLRRQPRAVAEFRSSATADGIKWGNAAGS